MKYFINSLILILLTNIAFTIEARFASNGFLVEKKELDFTKTIRSGECTGTVPYPLLSNGDEELIIEINDEIHDFVELYAICNQDTRNYFSVEFDVPEAGTSEIFSIRWVTKKKGKIWRIDVLNFHRPTGKLIEINDIFNMLSNNLMTQLVKLSHGHLPTSCKWDEFSDRVDQREIQFYLRDKKWFIIFNSKAAKDELVEQELPIYFLKGGDHDRG